jgi:hypothetical protein
MGFGDFFKEVGDGLATGLRATVNAVNTLDPFNNIHYDIHSSAAPTKSDAPLNRAVINPSVEFAASTMKWAKDNAMSQPISTLMLQAKGTNSIGDYAHTYFSADAWAKAWHAADHISPGQAAMLGDPLNPNGPQGASDAQKAIDSKLTYYEPASSFLPAGWDRMPYQTQQDFLKKAGMPATGNQFIEQKRKDSGLFKYGSGALDFGASWFLDPTVLAGKGAAALRAAKFKVVRPPAGWSGQDINQLMQRSSVKRMVDGIWANKDNPQLLNNTEMARSSAMGPRFGAVASTLQSPEEVQLFVRAGMGDQSAMDLLGAKNKLAQARIDNLTSRLPALDLRLDATTNPRMQAVIQSEIDRRNVGINADTAMVQRYNQILDHSDTLNQLATSRWSFARAADRTEAQNAYTAGAARFGGASRAARFTPSAAGKPLLPGVTRAERPAGQGFFGTAEMKSTPIDGGMIKSHVYGIGDFFSTPVTLVQMLKNARPNGYMRIDDLGQDSLTELRGHLARIPGITPETRSRFLNEYLKTTTETSRKDILENVGRLGAAKVAEKHGLTADEGSALFSEHMARVTSKRQRMAASVGRQGEDERYSGATDPSRISASGQQMRVDEFTVDGVGTVVSPFTATRMMNDHVFQDLDLLDKTLARHSSALKALRVPGGTAADWVAGGADYLSYLWKFTTLFRLGYIPRVLSDDLSGQVAALGAASMAMRIKLGVSNGLTNAAMRLAKPALEARAHVAGQGLEYADQELKLLQPQIKGLQGHQAGQAASNARDLTIAQGRVDRARQMQRDISPQASQAQVGAVQKLFDKHVLQLQQAQARVAAGGSQGKAIALQNLQNRVEFLNQRKLVHAATIKDIRAAQVKSIQGTGKVHAGGQEFESAIGGEKGDFWNAQVSSGESIGNMFNDNRVLVQGNLERSFAHGAKPITAAQDEAEHAKAWTHAINHVIMQDEAQRMLVQGASAEQVAQWMTKDPRGIAYRARLPKMIPTEDLANSMKVEVDQYLHTPEIRAKALEPDGVTPAFLKEAVPDVADRPQVHIAQMGQSTLEHAKGLDRVIQHWFKTAAEIPADRMSRHPLFNQLYEGHLRSIVSSRVKQGSWDRRTVADVDHMTTAARRLALNDTRKLVFDIAHRSDAAAAMKFISPFFSATSEAFQRWGRILADRPQVAGYAGMFFNAPLATGSMQDADGNHILPDGSTYTLDPKTGKAVKRMVPKSERYIVAIMPKWLAHGPIGYTLGVEQASGTMALSQNSMDLVTQGDPWFNPGVGPIVQIPVNALVQDKPKAAEMMRHLGVLPFGPATGSAGQQAWTQLAPKVIRDLYTSIDTSDERYQSIKLHIMQKAAYEHDNLHKPMPTAAQIASMTRNYWLFTAASSFLQPMATQRKDGYQFYRDQYNNLRRTDAMTADDKFLEKYGESYFVFAQSQSKNSSGIQATMKAVDLQKKHGDLIAASPELAALIVGPEGNGPFSPEAYSYQLNNPIEPGGAEAQRTKMSATDAMQENQRRLGWAQFSRNMHYLDSQLHAQGFQSYTDPGAEQLAAQKKGVISVYAEPLMPDGSANPNYNEQWSKDWFSLDARKYDRLIPALTKLANSPMANERTPTGGYVRSDLQGLQQYLGARTAVLQALQARGAGGGAKTLTAKANADLASAWTTVVDNLIEKDTTFGDLYHRYLSRDLGIDAAPVTTQGGA